MNKKQLLSICIGLLFLILFSCHENVLNNSKTQEQLKLELMPRNFTENIKMASSAVIEGLSFNGTTNEKMAYSIIQYGKLSGAEVDAENYLKQVQEFYSTPATSRASSTDLVLSDLVKKYLVGLSKINYSVSNYAINSDAFNFASFSSSTKKSIDSLENKIVFDDKLNNSEKMILLSSSTTNYVFLSQLQTIVSSLSSVSLSGRTGCWICNVFKAVVNTVVAVVQVVPTVVVGLFTGLANGLANGIIAAPFCAIGGVFAGFYYGIDGAIKCWGQPIYGDCFVNSGLIPSTKVCRQ